MLEIYNYNDWFENEETTNKMETVGLPDMPPLEGDEKEIKKSKRIKYMNSKQTINKTSNIISTNKGCTQYMQIKKWNETKTVSFVSAQ